MGNETIQSNPVNDSPQYTPISVGEWVITIIIIAIPIVGNNGVSYELIRQQNPRTTGVFLFL